MAIAPTVSKTYFKTSKNFLNLVKVKRAIDPKNTTMTCLESDMGNVCGMNAIARKILTQKERITGWLKMYSALVRATAPPT
ncbi:MAG: BBE domain-containing protein [Cyanobacteria bacterium CAN_BIN43]|nr:BBE domain-containing protein [Cyanobacteria bacterium CAN_BIN43]